MNNPTLIIVLAVSTLVAVLVVLLYQRFRVSKAKDTNEHSAMTKNRPDQRDTRR
jgi:hypothetical protein